MLRTFPIGRHRIPWALNAAVVAAQLALVGACFVAAAHITGPWAVVGLAVAFAIVMNSVYSTLHEAEHAMLFPNRRFNDAAGVVLALLFPAPFHLLRQGHIGHHLRNRSDDEAFDLYFDGDNVVWKYMVWYGILTGLYYVMVAVGGNLAGAFFPFIFDRRHFRIEDRVPVDRASAAFLEAFNASHLLLICLESWAVLIVHAAIVIGLGVPVGHYLAMYGAFGFTWSAMQYVHHFGTERHVTRGARNLRLFQPLDLLWLNHNWHRAHHEHPTVPWVYLPVIGAAGEDGRRRGFLPRYYLRMWRGPRKTDQHIENRYAGRIIQ